MIEINLELEPQDGVSTLDLLLWVKEILSEEVKRKPDGVVKGFNIIMPDFLNADITPSDNVLYSEGDFKVTK
jgi:hypothetical protein